MDNKEQLSGCGFNTALLLCLLPVLMRERDSRPFLWRSRCVLGGGSCSEAERAQRVVARLKSIMYSLLLMAGCPCSGPSVVSLPVVASFEYQQTNRRSPSSQAPYRGCQFCSVPFTLNGERASQYRSRAGRLWRFVTERVSVPGAVLSRVASLPPIPRSEGYHLVL